MNGESLEDLDSRIEILKSINYVFQIDWSILDLTKILKITYNASVANIAQMKITFLCENCNAR